MACQDRQSDEDILRKAVVIEMESAEPSGCPLWRCSTLPPRAHTCNCEYYQVLLAVLEDPQESHALCLQLSRLIDVGKHLVKGTYALYGVVETAVQ